MERYSNAGKWHKSALYFLKCPRWRPDMSASASGARWCGLGPPAILSSLCPPPGPNEDVPLGPRGRTQRTPPIWQTMRSFVSSDKNKLLLKYFCASNSSHGLCAKMFRNRLSVLILGRSPPTRSRRPLIFFPNKMLTIKLLRADCF